MTKIVFLKFSKTEIFFNVSPFFVNGGIFIGLGYDLAMISKYLFLQKFLPYDRNFLTIFLFSLNQNNVKIYQFQVEISIDLGISD